MRHFTHPGPAPDAFNFTAIGHTTGLQQLRVPEGADLLSLVEARIADTQSSGAAFRLLGGTVARLQLMTGKPDETAAMVATFSGPHHIACPATVLGGHGSVGSDITGNQLFSHAHAVFCDVTGKPLGCHLVRGECIAGHGGITLAIAYLYGARFHVNTDPQTTFKIFFPEASS
jgi:predicted DNA-binding protein with PD1-like motif